MGNCSRPSDAAVRPGFAGFAVETGRDERQPHETRYSPRLSRRLSRRYGALRLRPHVPDALDHQRRHDARGNLLELPPLLHRQAETCGHRRPRRALQQEIRRRRLQSRHRQKIGQSFLSIFLLCEQCFPGDRQEGLSHIFFAPCAVASMLSLALSGSVWLCLVLRTRVKYLANVATQSRMFDSSRPGELVESAPPRVTLRNAFAHPFDSAIAAARTCYAPRLITPEEVTDKQRLNIGAATFFSGHHTVYQHAHFEFGLENISRQFVWSFLHAHPFYNSEQQSQRYVRLDRAQAYVPPVSLFFDEKSKEIYEGAICRAWNYYRELSALLIGDARNILYDIWHVSPMSHPRRLQKIERSAEKRAIEIARYVLPVAAFTTMVHTLSGIVLHRLWRMCSASDTPSEARSVIGEMVSQVKAIDAQFFDRFGTEPLEELPEWKNAMAQPSAGEPFAREFDAKLNGKTSRLVDYSPNAIRVMAESYRGVAGLSSSQCSDAEALDRLLN